MNERISVIVPVYNTQDYLEKCVNAICSQTYKNIEIILVDDGSQDKSASICDSLAAKDERIRVIHKKNGGAASARNAGINAAEGEYLMFFDSDDYMECTMIEKLYNAVLKSDSDMAMCRAMAVTTDGTPYKELSKRDDTVCGGMLDRDEYYSRMLSDSNWEYIVIWNKIYKKKLFEKIRYPEGVIGEDEFVIHRIIYECDRIMMICDVLYYYVQRPDSVMHMHYSVKNLDLIFPLLDRQRFYIEKNIRNDLLITNFSWCLNEICRVYEYADVRSAQYRERFGELLRQYRALVGKIMFYRQPFIMRIFFLCGYISPRLTGKLKKKIQKD